MCEVPCDTCSGTGLVTGSDGNTWACSDCYLRRAVYVPQSRLVRQGAAVLRLEASATPEHSDAEVWLRFATARLAKRSHFYLSDGDLADLRANVETFRKEFGGGS